MKQYRVDNIVNFVYCGKTRLWKTDSRTDSGTGSDSNGRSQNTVPIASTQAAIKGIVQYSTRVVA